MAPPLSRYLRVAFVSTVFRIGIKIAERHAAGSCSTKYSRKRHSRYHSTAAVSTPRYRCIFIPPPSSFFSVLFDIARLSGLGVMGSLRWLCAVVRVWCLMPTAVLGHKHSIPEKNTALGIPDRRADAPASGTAGPIECVS